MWVNNGGDYITNTQFLSGDMPPDFDAWDIPSCWKIDPLVNDGYPYIMLMTDLPSQYTKYTNPYLYRILASDDMTSGNHYSVFISGVNSYRAIESPSAHSESSDSDEIP